MWVRESSKRRNVMTRWHRDDAESSWLRHATEDAKSDDKEGGAAVLILLSTNAETKRYIVWQGTGRPLNGT